MEKLRTLLLCRKYRQAPISMKLNTVMFDFSTVYNLQPLPQLAPSNKSNCDLK